MALDAALMEGADRRGFQPFFRVYQWHPGCLSLGRFQNLSTGLTPGALAQWPVVRRITGGGAILHQDELTYSLGFRLDDWPEELGRPTYEHLCRFLLDTWKFLGWEPAFAKDRMGSEVTLGSFTPACFSGQEKHDILIDGRKLGGNAQRRDREWVFQHGSIPLALDWEAIRSVFLPASSPDPEHTTDLRSLGYTGTAEQLAAILASCAEAHLQAKFIPTEVSPEIAVRAESWEREQFARSSWTKGNPESLRA